MIGKLVIFGDSYSTFKGHIPEGYAFYYLAEVSDPPLAVRTMQLSETWWQRFIKRTGAELVRNDSWSGSTISYTGYEGDCSNTSSFIYRYRLLRDAGFFRDGKVDTVIVFGGTNDSWVPVELGEDRGCDTEEDLYFALPAISRLMSDMKDELKDIRIVFVANCDINEKIIEHMEKEGKRLGIETVRLENIDKEEGHPTPLGMAKMCDQIATALGE